MEVYRWLLVFCLIATGYSQSTLQFVSVFFRHGSRTPEEKDTYPTDPYKIEDFSPMGWGQLTNPGKLRAFQLGKLLRDRYDSFLGDIYTPETAVTLSTDFDRTKMTALLVLAGLFPPAPTQQWTGELAWNPIPYDMHKADYDYFLRRPTAYCPAYVEELEKVLNSDYAARAVNETKKTMEYITRHSGRSMKTLMDVFRIYQTLNAEDNMNLTLPEWTQSVYPERVHAIAARQCQLENYNSILKRLNGGRILGRVIENMKAKASGKLQENKIFLYSGHENNVINVLAALNLYEPHIPTYSAAVILELHSLRESESYAVKVLYARDVLAEPENLSVEGCDNLCPLDKFVELTRPHVPVNYTAECGSNINLG